MCWVSTGPSFSRAVRAACSSYLALGAPGLADALSSAQSLSPVARQASLSITNSQSLLKLMSITSVMPSNHLILCRPLLLPPSILPRLSGMPLSRMT